MEAFKRLFLEELAPAFFAGRQLDIAGLRMDWARISQFDADNFVRTWNASLLSDEGRGHYRMPRSYASERFFWEGERRLVPQPVTLFVEGIVTVATLGRLHLDFGWPKELLGLQSKDYTFDLAAFPQADADQEAIACEVKKSKGELDRLIGYLGEFGDGRPLSALPKQAEKNAHQKYRGLISRRAPIFWAVAPEGYEFVFHVRYGGGDTFALINASTDALTFGF